MVEGWNTKNDHKFIASVCTMQLASIHNLWEIYTDDYYLYLSEVLIH